MVIKRGILILLIVLASTLVYPQFVEPDEFGAYPCFDGNTTYGTDDKMYHQPGPSDECWQEAFPKLPLNPQQCLCESEPDKCIVHGCGCLSRDLQLPALMEIRAHEMMDETIDACDAAKTIYIVDLGQGDDPRDVGGEDGDDPRDVGDEPLCGNGIIDTGEQCDPKKGASVYDVYQGWTRGGCSPLNICFPPGTRKECTCTCLGVFTKDGGWNQIDTLIAGEEYCDQKNPSGTAKKSWQYNEDECKCEKACDKDNDETACEEKPKQPIMALLFMITIQIRVDANIVVMESLIQLQMVHATQALLGGGTAVRMPAQ